MISALPSVLKQCESAEAVMARHAATFSWANRLMPRAYARDFAVLYAFCRLADDVADEAPEEAEANEALAIIREGLESGSSAIPPVREFLELSRKRQIPLDIPLELLTGVGSDLGPVRIADQDDLIRYAYRVASTVGLMVCHIVDLRDPTAHAHAIDLGIGMQLTNICRDVVEDALNDRVYLPAAFIAHDVVFRAVHDGESKARNEVYDCVLRTLDRADAYYRSGYRGICYLPVWARAGVLTAGKCYAAIGRVIRRRGRDYWSGRCATRKPEKTLRTVGAMLELLGRPRYWTTRFAPTHDVRLHPALFGLPGADISK